MAITTINENDYIKDSRTVINSNFTELDTLKAPLNSPALTGTPTAPTPTHGDDSTKVATTEFVQDALDGATPVPIPDSEIEEYWEDLDPAEREQYLPLTGGTLTGVVNGVTPPLGDYSNKLATTKYVKDYADSCVPTGCVQAFAGSTTPNGWLLCDGSAVGREAYANLFAVIGTTYGAGDGTDTFNLPNLVDKFVEGSTTAGTEKSAGLPNITGSALAHSNAGLTSLTRSNSGAVTGAFTTANGASRPYIQGTGAATGNALGFDASASNNIYGNSTTVQPPSVTMRYIIKA